MYETGVTYFDTSMTLPAMHFSDRMLVFCLFSSVRICGHSNLKPFFIVDLHPKVTFYTEHTDAGMESRLLCVGETNTIILVMFVSIFLQNP